MDEEPEYFCTDEEYSDERERAEAREAGQRALESLKEAREYLTKASNWGLVDIFGGNILSGAMKHARISDAKDAIGTARSDIQAFQAELGDVHEMESMKLDVDSFLTFADFVFDGAIADILVQSRIEKAKDSVDDAIREVKRALQELG